MNQATAWTLLLVSGLLDVGWAVSMKYAQGYSRPGWTLLSLVFLVMFIYLLGLALKTLPLGTAYAVWAGVGAVGSTALGSWLFGEPVSALRLGSVALVVAGIAGLKLSTG